MKTIVPDKVNTVHSDTHVISKTLDGCIRGYGYGHLGDDGDGRNVDGCYRDRFRVGISVNVQVDNLSYRVA